MKKIEQLSGTPSEVEMTWAAGPASIVYEHPQCKGWFVNLYVSSAGLKFRHANTEVGISFDDLLALAAQHAPGLLPSESEMASGKTNPQVRTARLKEAAERRQQSKPG